MKDPAGWMPGVEHIPSAGWGYPDIAEDGMFTQAVVSHVAQGYWGGLIGIAQQADPGKSWHFSISRTGEIAQHVSIADPAWHAGDVNAPTWRRYQGGNPNKLCVTADTPVLRANLRWAPAGDLQVGDELLAFDEYPNPRRHFRSAVVTANAPRKAPVYRIVMDDESEIYSTGEHRWLMDGGSGHAAKWLETEQIPHELQSYKRRGLRMPRYVDLPAPDETSYAAGYLAAAFDGEGALTYHDSGVLALVFGQRDNAMLARVREFLTAQRFRYSIEWRDMPFPNGGGYTHLCYVVIRGGRSEQFRFLALNRPERLIARLSEKVLDHKLQFRPVAKPSVVSCELAGEREIAALSSSTQTYIAAGYGAHNTVGIEHEGFSIPPGYSYDYLYSNGNPWPEAMIEASIRVHRWVFARVNEWDAGAMVPSEDTVITHSMLNTASRKQDPGDLWLATVRPRILAALQPAPAAPIRSYGQGFIDGRNAALDGVIAAAQGLRS